MLTADILVLMGVAGFLAAVLHSLTGFGGALFLVTMLTPLIGVRHAVPVTTAAMIVANASRIHVYWHDIPWRVLFVILPMAVPGIIIGAILFVGMVEYMVSLLIGSYLICAVVARRLVRGKRRVGRGTLGVASAIYGLVGGISFGAGLILAPFLLGAGIAGAQLVATVAVAGFVLNGLKSLVFGWSEAYGAGVLWVGVLVGFCAVPGTYLGRWLLDRLTSGVHTWILEAMLVLMGLWLIVGGVRAAATG